MRVVPSILPLPNLPTSARKVPQWVLSSVVVTRLEALIASMHRTFAPVEAEPAEEPYPLLPLPSPDRLEADWLPDSPSPVNMLFSFSRQDWNSFPNFC